MNHKSATRSLFRSAACCLVAVGMFVPQAAHAVVSNLALDGTASQSTTDFGGVASRGNDGNTNGSYGGNSVTHTGNGLNSFWEVDLGIEAAIDEIVLFNRTDNCCGNRLSNFRVSVFNIGGGEVFGQDFFATGSVGTSLSIDTDNAIGTRVRVQFNGLNNAGNGYLSLAEVQVMGEAVPEPTTAAMAMLGLAGVAMRRRRRGMA